MLLVHVAGNARAAAFYEREGFVPLRTDPALDRDPAAASATPVDGAAYTTTRECGASGVQSSQTF